MKIIIIIALLAMSFATQAGSCSDYGETGALVSTAYASGMSQSAVTTTMMNGLSPADKEVVRAIIMIVYQQGWDEPTAVRTIVRDLCNNGWE